MLRADTLVVMLKADTLVDMLRVVTLKADMLVDTIRADTQVDTTRVVGVLVLVNTVVSKITGMLVNRHLDTIKCFKAKVLLTRWDLVVDTAATVVVTAVELVSVQ